LSEKVPITVALGIGFDGKPHASRFSDSDVPLVARAAELMGFYVVQVAPDNEELHGVAEQLPRGRIFSTGRAFVPFVSRAAFDKLAVLVEGGVTARASATGAPEAPDQPTAQLYTAEAINTADALWSKIEIGTMVLAEQPELYGPGWWQCVVVAVDGDDFTLRWVDDPSEPPFRASRRTVGLRHPSSFESTAG
jgi:hypothetical protein